MDQVVYCAAKTKNGSKCHNKAKFGDYCGIHKNRTKFTSPSEVTNSVETCPICLENVTKKEDAGLSCAHFIHLKCAQELHDARCPICRTEITEKNSKLQKKKVDMIKKKRREDVQEMYNGLTNEMLEDEENEGEVDFGQLLEFFAPGQINKAIELVTDAFLSHTDVYSDEFHHYLHIETGIRSCTEIAELIERTVFSLCE